MANAVDARDETLESADGQTLLLRTWRAAGPARGVVAIVHGFNSHSGQYDWPARRLAADGLAVYAIDLRGRGRSSGERFFVARYSDYVDDVAMLVAHAKAREPGLPVILLGHSAGGVIACVYALDHQDELAGLVCESFAYRVPAPDFVLTAFKGIAHVAPHLRLFALKNADFTRDRTALERLDADPLIAGEKQPSQTVAELVRAGDRLTREFARLKLPLFILHGTADRATRPDGSRSFYAAAGARDKTLNLYDGHAHDLLADIGKEGVLDDILRWIDAHLVPAAQPRAATGGRRKA